MTLSEILERTQQLTALMKSKGWASAECSFKIGINAEKPHGLWLLARRKADDARTERWHAIQVRNNSDDLLWAFRQAENWIAQVIVPVEETKKAEFCEKLAEINRLAAELNLGVSVIPQSLAAAPVAAE